MEQFKFGNSLSIEQKLIDFSKIQRKGTIELKPIRMTRHRNPPDVSFRCFFNTKTSEWHGIPISKNPDGTFKFKPIRISGAKFYNLENEQDAMEWAVVKDYYRIKGGAMERDPLFEVNDIEAQADKEINLFSKTVRAGQFVTDLTGNKLVEFGRLFGIDPNVNSPGVTTKMLLEIAKTKPNSIIEKMESDQDTSAHIVLKRAMSVGLIKHTIDRGYVFKDGIGMGTTEKGAIDFLRKEITLLSNIDSESKSLDKFYKSQEAKVSEAKDTGTAYGVNLDPSVTSVPSPSTVGGGNDNGEEPKEKFDRSAHMKKMAEQRKAKKK